MDIQPMLRSLEQTAFSQWVTLNPFGFRVFETLHVIAVVLVFGSILVVDLRLLGFPSTRQSFREIAGDALRWTWIAFTLAVVTGFVMFTSKPVAYSQNPFFLIKLGLLALAGINMLVFELVLVRTVERWDRDVPTPVSVRLAGTLSLLLWLSVIFAGRWIGFYEPPGPTVDAATLPDVFGGAPF